MELRTTARGMRLVHGGYVISELPREPGPTHSVVDLFAAAVATRSPGPSLALLGFAAGGLLAPLRALGLDDRVDGVDLDLSGAEVFFRVADAWAGDVSLHQRDAAAYLARSARTHPCIIDDLSVNVGARAVQKPAICLGALPALIASRLTPGGVALINLLPGGPRDWPHLERGACAPFRQARVVRLERFENRIVVGGHRLPPPRVLGRELEAALSLLGSKLAGTVQVRGAHP